MLGQQVNFDHAQGDRVSIEEWDMGVDKITRRQIIIECKWIFKKNIIGAQDGLTFVLMAKKCIPVEDGMKMNFYFEHGME